MRARGWLAIAVATLGVSATAPFDRLTAAPSAVAGQQQPAPPPASSTTPGLAPMRIYIRGGLKTHGPGQHDYPQYLADWSKVLTERGAIVDGSLYFPTAAEIANTDVVVMHKDAAR